MPRTVHAWEEPQSDSEEEPRPHESPVEAARVFLDMLVDLYMTSVLSAQTLCVLCYWASKAGLQGLVSEYAKAPGGPSGHYQRHLNHKMGFDVLRGSLYTLSAPGLRSTDVSRTPLNFTMRVPHEVVNAEATSDPTIGQRLYEAVSSKTLPPTYFDHPLVLAGRGPVLPLALYMDGVAYSMTDTVVGVWVVNVITGARHVVGLIRKQLLCQCGCRGWDTFYPVLRFLHWSFSAMAAGHYPEKRHDGAVWAQDDSERATLAGTPLKFRCCLLFVKGDWAEFCERLGFPGWASGTRPCFCCAAPPDSLYSTVGVSVRSLAFHVNADSDYEAACTRCELWVTLSHEHHKRLCALLRYDKRPGGSHGRALVEAFPPLHLLAGDRLEPSPSLEDIGRFDDIASFPARVLFWRPAMQSLCHRRCPLLDASLGITPVRTIALDLLHTLYLGPMLTYCRLVLWKFLRSSIWATGPEAGSEKLQVTFLNIRSELRHFYEEFQKANASQQLSRVSNLTWKMLGSSERPKLKTRAAETYGLLLFAVHLLDKFKSHFPQDAKPLSEAGVLLLRYVTVVRSSPIRLPLATRQELVDIWCRCMTLARLYPGLNIPKTHLMLHLNDRIARQGNSSPQTTWLDESLNKTLKSILRLCHQSTFEQQGLLKCDAAFRDISKRQRR